MARILWNNQARGRKGTNLTKQGTRRGPGIPAQAGLLSLPASPGEDRPWHEAPGETLHGTFRILEALKKKIERSEIIFLI